jgi:Holliday junction DNA helicase RuvB
MSELESIEKLPLIKLRETPIVGENLLRPKTLTEYVGQRAVTSKLDVFIRAAKKRLEPLDHVLLAGPPGLGKTTLAHIVAGEMKGGLHSAPGPSLQRPADLMAILTNLKEGDIFFIDEIHRLSPVIEESLFLAMEDFKFEVIMGEGVSATPVSIPLQKFTLIGATTQSGKLSGPFRDRFGIHLNLDFYEIADMKKILERSANILKICLSAEELDPIAARSRGTPRIANRLIARVRDFVEILHLEGASVKAVQSALDFLEVDGKGLQLLDRRYLKCLAEQFKGGPAGVEALAASLSEDRATLEEMVEPYLLKEGYIIRTPRGRVVTDRAYSHLGLVALAKTEASPGLF